MKYAIFAVCMPEYDIELGATKIKEWGYDAVEWRVCEITSEMMRKPISYWGKNKTTIDFNNFLENAAKAKQICDKVGLEICALDFDFIYPDKDKAKLAFEGAKLMGVPKARFETARYEKEKGFNKLYDETLDYLGTLQQLAKESGIKALIELRAGSITPSPALLAKVMANFDPQYLGITLDPGNMIYEGHMNIDLSLDLIGPYLSHVHVKNSGWKEVNTSADGNVEWQSVSATLLGGIVSWRHVLQQLRERGYDGCLSVEDLSQLRTTEVKLKDDLKVLKIMNKALEGPAA
jgi:sugar phosphate isomerase/epimerase